MSQEDTMNTTRERRLVFGDALETLDAIDLIFESVRGFPDKPEAPCADLCGNQWCDNFGCIFNKTAIVRESIRTDAWQDISTAPMDGTAVWLLLDGQLYIGWGEKADWLHKTDRWYVASGVRRRGPQGQRFTDEIFGCHGVDVKPTHWMPLPAPPDRASA